ncbi:MAG: retropepsin-like aspartic protease [Deltaproteobacteria bacterium]|nr:retropepsin-like aspartic protease [Deltaproteobacteria bacterium]
MSRAAVVVVVVAVAFCGCRGERGTTARLASRDSPQRSGEWSPDVLAEPDVSPLGSDLSNLPRLYPHGDWLTIEAPLLSMQVLTRVDVNGRRAVAVLDTGAMGTTMSQPVAARLGILDDDTPRGAPVRAVDAHGDVIFGEKLELGELVIGRHRFKRVNVTVLGDSPDLFLVGADVLQDLDLYIAADEGLVGIFDAGQAPRRPGELVVTLQKEERQLFLRAAADSRSRGRSRFGLLIDTGAWNTSVPASIGINGGIPADLSYSATTVGVAGEQEARGRFVMDPLFLGTSDLGVGRVLAVSSTIDNGNGFGLLGNDVFMRFHTVLSFRDGQLRFRNLQPRPSERSRGPAGVSCKSDGRGVPCVKVSLAPHAGEVAADDLPGVCLQIDVDQAYAGQTVELAITAEDPNAISLFNGGAIRAFLSVDQTGSHHCFAVWRQLEKLGMTPSTKLTLRWVRTEGVMWPCDPMKTRCITFTGPLARLATK